ncbi:hypothetical protein BRAS3843_410031 [Bradyrhizobium sp. STM 3843]|nr:hypothetical protein BRAS3843_410031 [Bradyrhizobium sp. STM 3843]
MEIGLGDHGGTYHRPIPHRHVDPMPVFKPFRKLFRYVAASVLSRIEPKTARQWLDRETRLDQFG